MPGLVGALHPLVRLLMGAYLLFVVPSPTARRLRELSLEALPPSPLLVGLLCLLRLCLCAPSCPSADYRTAALGRSPAPCHDCLGCCPASCSAAAGAPPLLMPRLVGIPPPVVRLLVGASLPTALLLSLAPPLRALSFLVVVLCRALLPPGPLYRLRLDSWVLLRPLRDGSWAHRCLAPCRSWSPLLRALSALVVVLPPALLCCLWCSAIAYA